MGGTPRGRKPRTPARRTDSDDEPSDGNAPPALAHAPSEQRMSKEKQKFFRFSAFNLVERRRRRDSSSEWERWGGVRVTRVQRVELRLASPSPAPSSSSPSVSASPSASPSPSPSPERPRLALPPALAAPRPLIANDQFCSVFERLAADTSPDGAWGFAAEAQKQRRADRPETPPAPAHRRRRSRCGDRLLTTLFDGLSEFYSVRTPVRAKSRARSRAPAPPPREESQERQVLKETRSTFRRYQASLRRGAGRGAAPPRARGPGRPRRVRTPEPTPERSPERSPSRSPERSPERSPSRERSAERPEPRAEARSPPRLSASQLVRNLAACKRRASSEDAEKLYRGLALASRTSSARPATNQTGKNGS